MFYVYLLSCLIEPSSNRLDCFVGLILLGLIYNLDNVDNIDIFDNFDSFDNFDNVDNVVTTLSVDTVFISLMD